MSKLPQLSSDQNSNQDLINEKNLLKADNQGCDNKLATQVTKEYVKADGNCLFNCATLALQNTVSSPQETREILASVILSDPMTFSAAELGKHPEEYVSWLCSGNSAWGGIPELKALAVFF